MPHLDHTGPEAGGSKTGRKLGLCKSPEISEYEMGQGMGLKRKAPKGNGLGKRLRSSSLFNNNLK